MVRRKGNGTSGSSRTNKLPPARQLALDLIARKSRAEKVAWVDVQQFSTRPLKGLSDLGFVELQTSGRRIQKARLTDEGWTHLGQEQPVFETEAPAPAPEPEQPARRPSPQLHITPPTWADYEIPTIEDDPAEGAAPPAPVESTPAPPLAPAPINREVDETHATVNGHQPQQATPAPAADCGDNCRHRQVLRLLMGALGPKSPQFIELIDALETVQRLTEEL